MLVEIHVLQNHSPSNLNRDDTGSPKECTFGGVKRARISSQCLKRSIRRSDIFQQELEGNLGSRTRRLPEFVRQRLLDGGISAAMAEIAAKKTSGFGTKEGKEGDKKADGTYETRQTMFLTEADIAAVTDVMKVAIAEAKTVEKLDKVTAKDLQSKAEPKGFRPVSVDVALFGRMTTSEALRDVEAAAQVAHALSTHKVDHEYDYFTAVDDLQGTTDDDNDSGADMIGDVEFNSACYYKYFSIDVDGLVDNLIGTASVSDDEKGQARELAAKTVDAFLRAAVMTTPSGKQNTFAAHQLPASVLIEIRPYATPVSYANAFVEPARAGKSDLVSASIEKLTKHAEALTEGFDLQSTRRFLLAPEHTDVSIKGVERKPSLSALRDGVKDVILNG